eukprot:Skav219189  [mRNA]  locus=scaffold648:700154:705535:+ [translate_table: standard]
MGIGVLNVTPFEAERSALWWTAAFLLQEQSTNHARILFDSTSAGYTASGDFQGADCQQDFGIGSTLRAIFQKAGHHRSLSFHHVKGHTGQAGNELADAIAFAVCRNTLPEHAPLPQVHVESRTARHFMQWLFADLVAPDRPRLGKHQIVFDGFQAADSLPFTWRPGDLCKPVQDCTFEVTLKMLSYNVLTTRRHGTIALLRQQLVDSRIVVAGFQETRDKTTCVWPGNPYFRFCSAASPQGHGGLQLWVSNQIPVMRHQGKPFFFHKKNFTVGFSSPRLLIVHGHVASLHFCFVVGHAPHSSDDSAEAWWKDLSYHLASVPDRAHLMLMIDANARMQGFDDACCGTFGANHDDPHVDCSDLFHQVLIERNLCLPATFSSFHTGDHATWSIGDRKGSRLDYVAVPAQWKSGILASHVDRDFRSGVSDHDHRAVIVDSCMNIAGQRDVFHRRIPLDRIAMLSPEGRDTCRRIFENMPCIPSQTDPTIHCHVMEQYLHASLQQHFRLNRRTKKKVHLQDATYEAVLAHRDARRQLRDCHRWKDNTIKIGIFQHWAGLRMLRTQAPHCTTTEYRSTLASIDRGILNLSHQLLHSHRTLQLRLREDKRALAQEVANQIAETPLPEIWNALKPLLPKHRRDLHSVEHMPGLRDHSGQFATSPSEVAQLFQQHFAQAEGGTQHHPDEVVRLFLEDQKDMCRELSHKLPLPNLEHVPTLQAVEGKFRKLKKGRAGGPDGLPGELFLAAPQAAAEAYYGIFSKVAMFGADPLQWRGGIVKAIFKRGPTCQASSWRNILLSSIPGKAVHSLIRDALDERYQRAAHAGQFGGKHGASITVPTMGVRSFQHWCRSQSRSYALIFVDGIEAFYRLVRELCFSFHDYRSFVNTINHSGVSEKLQRLIIDNALQVSAMSRARASEHLTAVTRGLHRTTWFVCEQESQRVALTHRGSRPGDPVADVLFNLVMGRAMQQIESKLREQGLLESFHIAEDGPLPQHCRGHSTVDFSGQAWVDDLLFMKSSDAPHLLCEQVSKIVSIVQTELATMGIDMNLAKGKSEAIVHLAGPGSRALKRQLHLEQGSLLRFEDVNGEIRSLHVGHRYKYLGSILSIQGNCMGDIKYRTAQTFAALKLIRRPVLRNHRVEPRVRQLVLHSVILSKMMATSGSWILDTKAAEICFHKSVMRIYRYVFSQLPGWDKNVHHSHEDIITTLGVLWPQELLHVHRLRGLIAAVTVGTLHIWALLQADQSWLTHVQDGLNWITNQLSMSVLGESTPWSLSDFISLCERSPHRARGLLRKAQSAALNMRIRAQGVQVWHRRLREQLQVLGYHDPPDSADDAAFVGADEDHEGFLCPVCAKHFQTPHQVATHMMRAHNIHADHYLWATRTSCLCCMQEFHSTKRLSAHFQHGGLRCLEQLKLRYHDPQLLADDHRTPDMDHVPFAPIEGPVEEWCATTVDEHRGWIHKPRRPAPKPMMKRIRNEAARLITPAFPSVLDVTQVQIPRHIPMPTQFIVHFFSGRRREGDLQFHLESQASDRGLLIKVLSLDVAVDATLGNLATDQAFTFWNGEARRGFIHSFVAGPPCETFTKARFREGGPPPLRSKAYRWGLPGLLGRLHSQVESGNFLWRFSTSMLISQMIAGKGGVFEHPAPFDVEQGPCAGGTHTWCFPEMSALMLWPGAKLHLVDQGRYGQICRKPTGFLVLNHGHAAKLFQHWELPAPQWNLNAIEMGWNPKAKCFATAPLKEYPDRLNACLAAVLLSELATPQADGGAISGGDTLEEFVSITSHLHQRLGECSWGEMQPDWHRA